MKEDEEQEHGCFVVEIKPNSQDIAERMSMKILADIGRAIVRNNVSRSEIRNILRLQQVIINNKQKGE